ncbi:TonB-dependent receptor [Reichenbachiella carrageenanivorans]|uniref:TonB-dependent receptor n=1 Tax=Reichenbachiella carrageenanivorans TaxID=2979869 RepID=A0ABY6CUV2_9BACT|nr:TonB-dependent receptor [Reichenbachiella carrageenanivorans]UXX77686.1 TonB-dependent receptor [Reichenbachiella carrageenanivorans]
MISLLVSFSALSQVQISGVIYDAANKEPLPGAMISIHELNLAKVTDIDGRFLFENIRLATYHLHVSYMGYKAQTMVKTLGQGEDHIKIYLEPTTLELSEIVVESNHYKTGPKEQTLPMEILDAEFLAKNRKGTFVNSLEDIPGVSAINTGVGISKPVIRGMSFNRVIVNDKGVKQEGQQWGTDHGLEIDMFEPGRVEIIKGPGSLMYGSDGLGGVINIFPPAIPHDKEIEGGVQGIYKSNNHLIGTSAMVQGEKNDWVYRGRFSTQDFGDYRVPADQFTYNGYSLPIYDERLKNTAGKERNFTLMSGVKKNWGYSTLTVSNFHQKAGLFAGAVGIPRSYQLEPDGSSRNIDIPYQKTNHFKVSSNSNVLLGGHWLEMDWGYQRNQREEHSDPTAHGREEGPDGTLEHGLDLQTLSVNTRYFWRSSESHTRIIGLQGQYQWHDWDGFAFLLPAFTSSSVGLFAYEEYSWARRFTATGGLRLDYATRDITGYSESDGTDFFQYNEDLNRDYFNVSGALGLSFYPNDLLNMKLNLGSSFRVPTPNELAINGLHHGTFRYELGNSDLTSERGLQVDFSLSYQKKNFSLVVTPFASYFDGFIYLAATTQFSSDLNPFLPAESGQIYQYRQNDAVFAGTEVAMEYHMLDELHWRAAYEYVYNYNLDTKLPLPFTPPGSLYTELEYGIELKSSWLKDIHFGTNAKWVFDQNRVDRNENTTPGYWLLGANVGMGLAMGKKNTAQLAFSAQNLLDKEYYNHLSRYRLLNLPEQGRNFVISLHIPLAIQ